MSEPVETVRLVESAQPLGRLSLMPVPAPAHPAVPDFAARSFAMHRAFVVGTAPQWLTAGFALPGSADASEGDEAANPTPWEILLCADSVEWPGLESGEARTVFPDDLRCVRIVPGASAKAARAAFRAGHRRLLPFVAPARVARALNAPSPGRWRHIPGIDDVGKDELTRAFLRHLALSPGLDPLHRTVAELGVSLRTLERHVSEQLGAEPRQIRMDYRADLRDWLLLCGFTLAVVARTCGYATDSVLCSAVRSETGETAREWARTLMAEVGL